MIPVGVLLGDCPVHGEVTFVRCEPCQWMHCPEDECHWVIPDETVTPDGADPIEWPFAGVCPAVAGRGTP